MIGTDDEQARQARAEGFAAFVASLHAETRCAYCGHHMRAPLMSAEVRRHVATCRAHPLHDLLPQGGGYA